MDEYKERYECYEVDTDGFIVETYLYTEEEIVEHRANGKLIVDFPWKQSFHKQKFNFELNEWFEGLPKEEIDIKMGRDLATLKANKDASLNQSCNESILAGFTHEINGFTYWFSYDYEAQGNFRDAKEMLSDAVLTEIPWTVRLGGKEGEYGRIPVNLTMMQELAVVIMNHKMNNISNYRDFLLPILYDEATDTPEKIEAVVWQ